MIRNGWIWRRRTERGRRVSFRLLCELMESRELLSTFAVTNTSDAATPSPNSLRWAILQVNNDTSLDTIDFDIPDKGVQTIQLTAPLPPIVNSAVIDGTSQRGYAGSPLIELDGSGLGQGASGLSIGASGTTVKGLDIVGFAGSAITIHSTGNDVVEANYLGVASASGQADGNGVGVTISSSSSNTIGGTGSGQGNLISGNTSNGIVISGDGKSTTDNVVVGNLIGTAASGLSPIGNGGAGVLISGASSTEIGEPAAVFSNVISGNTGPGIEVTGSAAATSIENNAIGVGGDGATVVGNGGDGILVDAATGSVIGGTGTNDGNVIGGNLGNGIETQNNTAGLVVNGNFIGTDSMGKQLDLANRQNGIQLASSSNYIGGAASSAGNTIEFNGSGQEGSGVQLVGGANEDEILSNSIYRNAGLGINLGDGPTPNHAPGTAGPNDYQNYPTLTSAASDASNTTITGSLYSIPSTAFQLQFFASPTPAASGFGQGKNLLGSFSVQTNDDGNASFTVSLPTGTLPGSYISATATDPSGNTSEFSADLLAQPEVDLVVSATASPSPVVAGNNLKYLITVTNAGTLAATGVTVSDQLPTSVTEVSAVASPGTIESGQEPGDVIDSVGNLAVGATATLTIVVSTDADSVGTITDVASASIGKAGGNSSSTNVTVTTTVLPVCDLAVVLAVSPSSVLAGDDLTDTFTISDLGPDVANDITATLPLPAGLTFVSAESGPATVNSADGQVTASLAALAANSQAVVTVIVEPTIPGNLTQTVTVSSPGVDDNLANNSSAVSTQVVSDLAVTITASAAVANPGVDFDYAIMVTNNGPSTASGVVLTDTVPAGATFVSASSTQSGVPTFDGGVVTLKIGSLSSGASVTLNIVVSPTAAPGSSLTDTASVASQQAGAGAAQTDETATLTTPVIGVSDLGITVSAQSAPVYVGEDFTETLTVSNQGPADEPDAVVTCPLPADVTFASASFIPGWTAAVANGILTADLGPLAAGATATVSVILVPQAAAAGSLATTFTVQGQNTDPVPTNNSAQATVTVSPAADLQVTISPGSSSGAVGVDWTYTLTVANLGLSDASGVTVTAPLPAGAQLVSATPSQGSTPVTQDGDLSVDLGAIEVGATATVSLVVMPTAVGSLALSAQVAGAQFDPNPSNDQAEAAVSVAPSVNLAVDLGSSTQTVVTGQSVTMTANIENTGPNPATSVVVSLPMGSNVVFDSTDLSPGAYSLAGGQFVAQLGELAPGSTAEISLVVTPQTAGTITQTATATAQETQLNPADATATTTVTVLESPGTLQFSASVYSALNTAGVADLTVVRTVGALGLVTVSYQTVAIDATPGLDFVPVSGTLTFASGQTVGTIQVPVLDDVWENHNDVVNVELSSPAGGAALGSLTTAQLNIMDVDPDTTPPEVSQLSWNGSSAAITSINLTFTAPLDATEADDPANYHLSVAVAGQPSIGISSVSYNAATNVVTLVPSSPLGSGQFYDIEAVGTGATAIRDLAGNVLDGAANGLPGSNYVASFGQGTKIQYVDAAGNKVSLKLTGGGYLDDVLSRGEGQTLTLMGEVPHRTVLSGTIKKGKRHGGVTNLGVIRGLGNFGDVRVSLKSPPFLVKQYPFTQKGRGQL